MSDELAFETAVGLLAGYQAGRFSPVDATRAALGQIDRRNPEINAFCFVDADGALAQAQASEARWQTGKPIGLLDGVPISIKDLALTAGLPSRFGSLISNADGPWDVDAPFVARLKEHGAVILGKTATPEYGWKGVTDSPLTGITRNPWKPACTPGGSSGGAAAALVCGMGALATGSDGGGSIRIPCGFTGIFGIKMNFGRIPVFPESAMRTLSHAGPMARNVADAALMANVMCEPDHRDWTALPYQNIDWLAGSDEGIEGLRIAFSSDLGYADVDPGVAELVARAVARFEELGADIVVADPGFDDPIDAFERHWFAGAAGAFGALGEADMAKLDPGHAEIIERGKRITITEYTDAMAARAALAVTMREFHQQYDLLLTPALAVPAFEAGRLVPAHYPDDAPWTSWTPFSYPFNLTQQPAGVICCGLTADGLPVGLQIVAPSYREDLVFRAARAYEELRGPMRFPVD